MPTIKEQVIEMIRGLPDECSVDDIMAELYFRLKVDAGRRELDDGSGIPHPEVKERLSRWLSR